jgi:hypothetical protein
MHVLDDKMWKEHKGRAATTGSARQARGGRGRGAGEAGARPASGRRCRPHSYVNPSTTDAETTSDEGGAELTQCQHEEGGGVQPRRAASRRVAELVRALCVEEEGGSQSLDPHFSGYGAASGMVDNVTQLLKRVYGEEARSIR